MRILSPWIVGVCVAALLLGCVTALIVAWANRTSQNIALTVGTLVGAVVLFVAQLWFELRPPGRTGSLSYAEVTIDRKQPWIGPVDLAPTSDRSLSMPEMLASQNVTPELFDGDNDKVSLEFVTFAVVNYVTESSLDWRAPKVAVVGRNYNIISPRLLGPRASDCTVVTREELADQLQRAGVRFQDTLRTSGPKTICLPPGGKVAIALGSVGIRTPLCEVTIAIRSERGVDYRRPGSREERRERATADAIVPKMDDGRAQFENRRFIIETVTTFFKLNSKSPHMGSYEAWAARLVRNLRPWFEDPTYNAPREESFPLPEK